MPNGLGLTSMCSRRIEKSSFFLSVRRLFVCQQAVANAELDRLAQRVTRATFLPAAITMSREERE
jgi:hypothetical protein